MFLNNYLIHARKEKNKIRNDIYCGENTDEMYTSACGIEKKYNAIFILRIVFFKNRFQDLPSSLNASVLNRTANNTM